MKKVIAFSLWGNDPMYNVGAIKNASLVQMVYGNSWTSRFYLADDVPQETIEELNKVPNTECIMMGSPNDWYGTFWRFLAIDDTDIAMFRDTDSRITDREYAAVKQWLDNDESVHIMRDHPYHSETILAGMWGCKSKDLINLINEFQYKNNDLPTVTTLKESIAHWTRYKIIEATTEGGVHNYKGNDQQYLREVVYPCVYKSSFIHDSFTSYNPWSNRMNDGGNIRAEMFGSAELNTGFPSLRKRKDTLTMGKSINDIIDWNDFVGQVYDENDIPNEEYALLIKNISKKIHPS